MALGHVEKLGEEFAESAELDVVLFEELVADRSLPQLHNEVCQSCELVSNLPCVEPWDLMWLHFFAIRLPKPGLEHLVLFFGDQVCSKFVFRVGHLRCELRAGLR